MKTLSGLLLFCLLTASKTVEASQPWDQPFSSDTAQILNNAKALPIPAKAGVLYLLEERHYEIQSDGATTAVLRRLYRVADQDAIDDWAELEQEWEPWHEERPELRARVISADGSVHWLDPKTIADAATSQFDTTIFSDSRIIRAPLPAVGVGSVIEYEIVEKETAPLFSAGVTREMPIGAGSPIERFHVVIDAAKGVIVKTGSRLLNDSAITRSEAKGKTHIEVEVGRQAATEEFEPFAPVDEASFPSFSFSTGSSWQAVAGQYQQVINQATANTDTNALFAALNLDPAKLPVGKLERAAFIASRLHQNVRYTGVEFGQAAIVPNAPIEVIHRHYGDCKDKATLLALLLKVSGLDARLVLLDAGSQADVNPLLPGLGQFNHAIVFVNAETPLWIDATADSTRVGDLPIQDQGRRALIIDPSTTALTTTPQTSSQDNQVIYTVQIHFRENGNSNIQVSVEAHGSFESQLRSYYTGDKQQVREKLKSLAKRSFSAKDIGNFEVTPHDDFSQPFRMSFEALDSVAGRSDSSEAAAALSNGLILESLPYNLLNESSRTDTAEKPRRSDFVFHTPYRAVVNFKIWPPPETSPKALPPPSSFKAGEFTYKLDDHTNPDGSVDLSYLIDTGKRRITAAEYRALSQGLTKALKSANILEFTFKTGDLLALGKSAEAVRLAQQDVAEHPQNVAAYIRLARLLMDCGAGDRALATARHAVEIDAKSAEAWHALGLLNEFDSFGRFRAKGWKPEEAEKALRRAMELDPGNLLMISELAILLEFDVNGQRYSQSSRLAEAVDLYKKALAVRPEPNIGLNLVIALIHMQNYKEAREYAINDLSGQQVLPAIQIALTALMNGSDRAIIESQSGIASEQRAANLINAAQMLIGLRHYPEFLEISKGAQRLSNDSTSAAAIQFLSKTKRLEEVLAPDDDPRRPVQLLLASIAGSTSPDDQLHSILSEHADLASWRGRVRRARQGFAPVAQRILSGGMSPDVLADITVSNSELTVHGEGRPAYLVDVVSQMDLRLSTIVVVKENGKFKLLSTNDGLAAVGRLALAQLNKGDLNAARAWLDQVKDNAIPIDANDDKGPAFRYLWAGVAPETRSEPFVRAAAASLIGSYSGSDDAVHDLRAVAEHPPQYMMREDLNFALCETFQQSQRWKELLETSRLLVKSISYGQVAYRFSAQANIHLHQWEELQRDAEARLAARGANSQRVTTVTLKAGQAPTNIKTVKTEDGWALHFKVLALLHQGHFEEAQSTLQREKEAAFYSSRPEGQLSEWATILSGKPLQEAKDDSEKRSNFGGNDPQHLYTKAMALIIAGELTEAKKVLTTALDIEQAGDSVSSLPWLVQGEMLERYKLNADAAVFFAKAKLLDNWESLPAAQFLLEKHLTADTNPVPLAKPQ